MSPRVGSVSSRARKHLRVAFAGSALALLTAAPLVGSVGVAGATETHTGCTGVAANQSSGWCGLYPGNATDNIRELGSVSLSADGTQLTVQTQDASTGVVPATSFACVTLTPAADVTHRLQAQLCKQYGGVWFPIDGGSQTINLAAYPQFLGTHFTVQVAVNQDAKNSNGDAFYNNFTVDTTGAGGDGGGIGIS